MSIPFRSVLHGRKSLKENKQNKHPSLKVRIASLDYKDPPT